MASRLDEAIKELREVRLLLVQDRKSLSGVVTKLRADNLILRDQKRALLSYIKELEQFHVDRADIEKLKDILLR